MVGYVEKFGVRLERCFLEIRQNCSAKVKSLDSRFFEKS
jgi:hypothetical protein